MNYEDSNKFFSKKMLITLNHKSTPKTFVVELKRKRKWKHLHLHARYFYPDFFIWILIEISNPIYQERKKEQEIKKPRRLCLRRAWALSLSHRHFVPMSFVLRLLASPEHFRVERWAIFDFIPLYSQLIYAQMCWRPSVCLPQFRAAGCNISWPLEPVLTL